MGTFRGRRGISGSTYLFNAILLLKL